MEKADRPVHKNIQVSIKKKIQATLNTRSLLENIGPTQETNKKYIYTHIQNNVAS